MVTLLTTETQSWAPSLTESFILAQCQKFQSMVSRLKPRDGVGKGLSGKSAAHIMGEGKTEQTEEPGQASHDPALLTTSTIEHTSALNSYLD